MTMTRLKGVAINPGVVQSQRNGKENERNIGAIFKESGWVLLKHHPKLAYPFEWPDGNAGNEADWLVQNRAGKQFYIECKSNALLLGSMYPKLSFVVRDWFPFHPDKNCMLVYATPNRNLKYGYFKYLRSQASANTTCLLIEELRTWALQELEAA